MKRIALIGILLVLALSAAGSANASGDKAPALAPGDPIGPSGAITSNVPQYHWESVGGATKYQIKVKKGFFTTIYDFKVTSGTAQCDAVDCWYYLPGILSNKDYRWKVRAKVGSWQSWSSWENFTVNASGGFKSSFNKNKNGWTKYNGNWKLAKGKYVTSGQQGNYATASHSGNYANFTYEVKFRRKWDGACSKTNTSGIYLRGTPLPLTANKGWDDVMRFTYTNNGKYQIGERVNGTYTSLDFSTSSAINKNGWNTFLVVAKGSTYWLYINGEYIRSITDSSHANGLAGVGFYQSIVCSDKFKVDWAKLSTNTPW